ncbi:retrotransposable element Tf2 [Tanacetum coccineum]
MVQTSIKKLGSLFYWKKMYKDVKTFVRKCDVCQRNKPNLEAYPGALQHLPISDKVWQDFSIDFVDGLPSSHALYGQPPTFHIPYIQGSSLVDLVDRTLIAKEEAIGLLKFYLKRSQADKYRTGKEFEVGVWVYLKFQPYIQLTVRQGRQHKLLAKFYGPFQIVVRIGKVAYRLQLPDHVKVHPVFHICQLNKCRSKVTTMGSFPICDDIGLIDVEPQAALDRRKEIEQPFMS